MVKSTKQKAMEAQVRDEIRVEREERARQKKEVVKAAKKDVERVVNNVLISLPLHTTPISHPGPQQPQRADVDYARFLKAKDEWMNSMLDREAATESHSVAVAWLGHAKSMGAA
eukprot:9470720-Pyramimonas_sp.AAC.2